LSSALADAASNSSTYHSQRIFPVRHLEFLLASFCPNTNLSGANRASAVDLCRCRAYLQWAEAATADTDIH
jgi:hypothetical protein